MKKAYVLILATCAALACSAALTSSAYALRSGVLASGADIGLEILLTATGKGILYDLKEDAGVECSGSTLLHVLWPEFWRTEVLTISLSSCTPTATALNAKFEGVANSCTSVNSEEAIDLPWAGSITLSGSRFLASGGADGAGEPKMLTECTTALGLVDDTCEAENRTGELTNTSSGIEAKLPTAKEESEKGELANCSLGGANAGADEGSATATTDEEGLTLSLSEG